MLMQFESVCKFILLWVALYPLNAVAENHNPIRDITHQRNISLSEDLEVEVAIYPTQGKHLIVWLAPEYGFRNTHQQISIALAGLGIEVWLVDLPQALFLTSSPETMRQLRGQHIADLIDKANRDTDKQITLLGSGYTAIPILKGAQAWQLQQSRKNILSGAILFSPSLYQGVPALGHDPSYVPVVHTTNIPLAILQASDTNNRWYLTSLLNQLHRAGSPVYTTLLNGVRDLFYFQDHLNSEAEAFKALPKQLRQIIDLLNKTPTPAPMPLAKSHKPESIAEHLGLDDVLRNYTGHVIPQPFQLPNLEGEAFTIRDYKGKVTLLNFWATWCPPCVEEIPSLNRLKKAMSGEEFELISINYAESPEAIQAFLDRISVDFPVLIDAEGKQSARWKVFTLPSTFVIGPDGSIRYGVNAAIEWDQPQVIQSLKSMLRDRR